MLSILKKTFEIEETLADVFDDKEKFNQERIISDLESLKIIFDEERTDWEVFGFAQTRYLVSRERLRTLGIDTKEYDEKYYQIWLSKLNLTNIQN